MNNLKNNRLKFKFKQGGSYLKYQNAGRFKLSDKVSVPDQVSNIPKMMPKSITDGFKGGYLGEQAGRTEADSCYKIINNKRTQVTCDGSDEQIVIPKGSTRTQQDEIFRREEKYRDTWSKPGTKGTPTIKLGDAHSKTTSYGLPNDPQGNGKWFKENDCKCTPNAPIDIITIAEFKSKLAGLPAAAGGVKNWGKKLLAAAAAEKATDEDKISLQYAKIIKKQAGTLDLGLLHGCMCGGSGKVTKTRTTDPETIPGKDTDPDGGITETRKVTKVVKGGYKDGDNPETKKQPRGVVKFGITVNLKGFKAPNGNDISDVRQGVWYKGELVRDNNGNATGLKWSGPFTTMPQGSSGEEVLDVGLAKGQSRSQFVNGLPEAQGGVFNIENAFSKSTFSNVQERDKLITEAINNKLSLDILNTSALEEYVRSPDGRADWFKGDGGWGEEKVNSVQSKRLGGVLRFQRIGLDNRLSYLFEK